MINMSLYTQDTWMMASGLNLTYGLRWDYNSVPESRDHNNGDLVQLFGNYAGSNVIVGPPGAQLWNQRYDNLVPRIGAAWVFRKHPGREAVLRAGGGLFYDTGIAEASSEPWVSGYPAGQATVLLNSHLPVSTSVVMPPPVNLTNPPPGNVFSTFAPNLRAPRVWEWNVTLQQAMGSDQTLTLAYVGSAGRRLLYSVAYPIVTSNIYSVVYTDDSGSSAYHALQLHYERRLSHGIAANVSYTWGHSIDTNSSDTATYVPGFFEPSFSNRADSDFDIRQLLHGAFSWNLQPAHGRAAMRALTAGWGLDGILTAQTALPVNVTVNRNIGFGSYDFRPDLVGGVPEWTHDPGVAGGRRINPAVLVVPSSPVQGNLGRNAFRGFTLVQTDLSVRRSFGVTDKTSLTFRADLFNALNHPNFANPISFIGSGLFGMSTQSVANSQVGGGAFGLNSVFNIGGPRAAQVSLKLQF
jgi:TonB dependent receptor